MARPTKLTPEVQDAIVIALRQGVYGEQAARAAGIAPSTYYAWMERGDAGEPPFSEFSDAVTRARAEAQIEAVAIIRKAMGDDWRAAAWFLWNARTASIGAVATATASRFRLASRVRNRKFLLTPIDWRK